MNYQLCKKSPFTLMNRRSMAREFPKCGIRIIEENRDSPPAIPSAFASDLAYVEIEEKPTVSNPDTKIVVADNSLDKIGWIERDLTEDELAARVPFSVARRNLFQVLNTLEPPVTRADIKAMIGDNEAALIDFEEAVEIRRSHPLISSLGSQLGKTSQEIDQMFIAASQIT